MRLLIDAACGCDIGKIRKNNEDNFFFDGTCLPLENEGLQNTACFSDALRNGCCLAVFDGMGGENFGEVASFTAARQLQTAAGSLSDCFVSRQKYLSKLAIKLNHAIVEARKELCTDRCGSTMAVLYFSYGYAYSCNIGDSRVYRLRDGAFLQLSVDHAEVYPEGQQGKAPLTQYLGIDPEDIQIEPSIARSKIRRGDMYLICSDGLTDMLTDLEIFDIMLTCEEPADCVRNLIQSALAHGGRDNITVIICKIN